MESQSRSIPVSQGDTACPMYSPPTFTCAVQVMTPLVLTFLVLVLAAALALWTSASGAVVIWATLISVGLMGATTALLQGGLFGLAGLCPPIYVQVVPLRQCYPPSCRHRKHHVCMIVIPLGTHALVKTRGGVTRYRERAVVSEVFMQEVRHLWSILD